MSALLRYVVLKSVRERSWRIVFVPAFIIFATVAGLMFGVAGPFGGHPFSFAGSTPLRTAATLGYAAASLACMAAGAAAFGVFQTELTNKSIGSFVLATHPIRIVATATLSGIIVAVCSAVSTVLVIVAATGTLPPRLMTMLALTLVASTAAAAVAICMASISPDYGMVLPAMLIVIPTLVAVLNAPPMKAVPAALAVALVSLMLASSFLQRRCVA